jgi:acylpyruvate hydrolase
MRDVFEAGAQEAVRSLEHRLVAAGELRARFAAANVLVPPKTADIGPPIDDPALVLAIGLNYRDHAREMGVPIPDIPYSFTKNRAAIVGPRDDIVLPASNPDRVDLEGELVIVIGSACHGVSESDAERCIGGYTIANDVSARDWVESAFQRTAPMEALSSWEVNLLGKQFPTFCPLGPYLVTSDEIADVLDLSLVSRVNGGTFQSSRTSELVFSPAYIVSYYSKFYRFEPGDLILTGTTSGVGYSRNPKYFLAAGDLVEIEIESLGALANQVVAAHG